MRSTSQLASTSRRFFAITSMALGLALMPAIVWAQTQQPPAGQQPPAQPPAAQQPAQQPPAQQQAAPQTRTFTSDGGMIFNTIKPDHTSDFEMVMGKVKEALAKSTDPKRKAQAAGWKVFKSVEPGPGGNVLYIFILDPAEKDADYTVSKILAEAFPNEVQDLWNKYVACYASGQNLVNLQLVTNMSGGAAAGGR